MAEDAGDKTEAPTPRRRSEARSRGQIAKSQELASAVLLLTSLIGLDLLGGRIWRALLAIMYRALAVEGPPRMDETLVFASQAVAEAGKALAPFLIVLVLAALLVMYAQVGFLFTWETLKPSLGKLNPINGFKRLFSAHSLVQLAQNVFKLALIALVAWISVRSVVKKILLAHTLDFTQVLALGTSIVFYVGIRLAIVLLLLAIIDYIYQRYRQEKQLKMTKEEVKEEMRRMEGDPMIKRRRREVQLRLAAERLKSVVPKADVVVTNPTHYAAALRYDPETMASPTLVAKGVDFLALRIREIAAASGIPIVEKPELARMLYADVEVGREIPERLFRAVAEILAYVYELGARRMGPAPVPVT